MLQCAAKHYTGSCRLLQRDTRIVCRVVLHRWLFLDVQGVEATNHIAERAHRFGVLWRKRSQGNRARRAIVGWSESCPCVTRVASEGVLRFRRWLKRFLVCLKAKS